MLFNSLDFLIFLPSVLALYYCLNRTAQNILIIAASYFFYGYWDWRFCGLLLFITLLNYFCSLGISCTSHKRFYLTFSIAGNLGVLGFFKYYNFFLSSFIDVAKALGITPNIPLLRVVLPLGISFFTFQAMSYTIDVYRNKMQAYKDIISVAAYISFFPQLVAGPIERAQRLLPQFRAPRLVSFDMIGSGLFLVLMGFFKKIAIADAVGHIVSDIFARSAAASWPELICGLWFFAIQIYCDFSGYSDIARGTARLFGFDLMENFNQPYFSLNVSDFWKRWHISLSTWLRDYLYIPLGGNRKGTFNTYRNLMITMILGGLWHGANWTFIVWGTLHGLYLVVNRWFSDIKKQLSFIKHIPSHVKISLSAAVTLNLVILTWVFFRAQNIHEAFTYLHGIGTFRGSFSGHGFLISKLLFFIVLIMFLDIPQYCRKEHEAILHWHWTARGCIYALMIILMILLAPGDETPFIYFQF